jgi:hypothetical protein
LAQVAGDPLEPIPWNIVTGKRASRLPASIQAPVNTWTGFEQPLLEGPATILPK